MRSPRSGGSGFRFFGKQSAAGRVDTRSFRGGRRTGRRAGAGANIELGERVFFNFNCVVLDVCPIRIGSFTLFGPAVQVYTPMQPMNAVLRRDREFGQPIDIGADVWIGGGAIILPGVRNGNGAVIGAGSVVTRDVPDGVFAAGNPCRVIREITE